MRTVMRCLVVAAFAVVVAGLADAQQPQRGRGQGGIGGGGGFGGPTFLVASKAVQEEIKITDEQKAKLEEWTKSYREKSRDRFAGLKDLSDEEKRAKFAEWNTEAWTGVGEVLKPEQVKRLKQIDLQQSGTRALARAEVQKELNLTDDQKAKLKEIADEARKDQEELRSTAGFTQGQRPDREKFEAYQKKVDALQKEVKEKTEKVLTDDQRKTWKDMTGEPFDTSKIFQGFGGTGGRPGGNRNNPEPKKDNN